MRKNTARHWLHATLDLLPVILIPVFMIYSHRHTIDSGSIQVPQNSVVVMKQNVNNGKPTSLDYITSEFGVDVMRFNQQYGSLYIETLQTDEVDFYYDLVDFSFNETDKILLKLSMFSEAEFEYNFKLVTTDDFGVFTSDIVIDDSMTTYSFIMNSDETGSNEIADRLEVYLFNEAFTSIIIEIKNIQLFNLTQMYGSGNEPTIEQFNNTWKQDYYSVDNHDKILVKGTSIITYNDTDIMSQMTYQLYNSVDKYFNMGNVFNMGALYDWFNLNIFNGNAPISIYIVWNIVLYEFVMDLLFLLYALFMWFIDMCKRLIEKPLDSIK